MTHTYVQMLAFATLFGHCCQHYRI